MKDCTEYTAEELKAMSLFEVERVSEEFMALRARIKRQHQVVAKALDEKESYATIQRKVDGMNDAERKAMAQALSADGIPSAERVGKPGE